MDLDFIFEETFKSILILGVVILILLAGFYVGTTCKYDVINYGKIKIGDDVYSCVKDKSVR